MAKTKSTKKAKGVEPEVETQGEADSKTSVEEEVPHPAETVSQPEVPAEVAADVVPTAAELVPVNVNPVVAARIADALEALESFDDMKLQPINIKSEGFMMADGDPPVDEFEGILVFTKESNVYYKSVYKSGQTLPPDCSSIDGKTPDVKEPQSPSCKTCPLNQYGSSTTGEGKACKNTRPTFFLVGSGLIPRVLRVPPTSLKNIKKYILNVATNYGSYFGVRTKVSIYKEDEGQTYNNIRFQVIGRVGAETVVEDEEIVSLGKNDVRSIRQGWMPLMKAGNFGVDEETANVTQADAPPMPDEAPLDPENPQF